MDPDMQELKKKIFNYAMVFVAVLIVIVSFWFYREKNKNIVPYNEYPEGNILLVRSSRLYPYKTMIAIYEDGLIKKSRVIDQTSETDKPQEHYEDVMKLSSTQVRNLKELISEVYEQKVDSGDNYYGIYMDLDGDSFLEDAGNYDIKFVERVNLFINSLNI